MEYLLKTSAVIALFYICYKIFLQRETFFESNRWFLLSGLVLAFIVPLIVITTYTTIDTSQYQMVNSTIGIPPVEDVTPNNSLSIYDILINLYFAGVIFFLGRFIIQFSSLVLLLLKNEKIKEGNYTFITTNSNASPFSFFKWIVYNPTQFNKDELQQIITHETIHARQLHSIDILLTQIASIICWFNPVIWLYKKELQQNLEFIADQNTQQQYNCKKSYQHLLLKTSVPNYQIALTNNFYNSLIKKRIVMLHKNRSQNRNQWKFALMIPVLALFLMSFNTKEVLRFEDTSKSQTYNQEAPKGDIEMIMITKDMSDNDLKKITETYEAKGISLKFKNIERNSDDEIVKIDIYATSNGSKASFSTHGDKGIEPVKLTVDVEENRITIGDAKNTIDFSEEGVTGYIVKDNTIKIKSGDKSSNSFVFSTSSKSDNTNTEIIEKDGKIIIKKGNTTHELKKDNKSRSSNVYISSGDDNEVIEITKDGDVSKSKVEVNRNNKNSGYFISTKSKNKDGETSNITISSGKDVKKEWEDKNGNIQIWTGEDGESYELKSLGKGNNKFFFSTNNDNEPLYIYDGKEISSKRAKNLDFNKIKSVNVLKGSSAKKKYGSKAKHGVVEIITKDKN